MMRRKDCRVLLDAMNVVDVVFDAMSVIVAVGCNGVPRGAR